MDNSGSMLIEDKNGRRGDSLQYAINQLQKNWPGDSLNLRLYQFAGNLHQFQGDSLNFDGSQTNISNALSRITDSLTSYNIRSLVLFSDGQFNEGINPLESVKNSPVAVHTVTVGDTFAKRDIKIGGIRFNPVMYSGDSLKIEVGVNQSGFQPEKVLVQVKQNNKQVAARSVTLPVRKMVGGVTTVSGATPSCAGQVRAPTRATSASFWANMALPPPGCLWRASSSSRPPSDPQ